jgi:hypothetical protein
MAKAASDSALSSDDSPTRAAWQAAIQTRRAVNVAILSAILNSVAVVIGMMIPAWQYTVDYVAREKLEKSSEITVLKHGITVMRALELYRLTVLSAKLCESSATLTPIDRIEATRTASKLVALLGDDQGIALEELDVRDIKDDMMNISSNIQTSLNIDDVKSKKCDLIPGEEAALRHSEEQRRLDDRRSPAKIDFTISHLYPADPESVW